MDLAFQSSSNRFFTKMRQTNTYMNKRYSKNTIKTATSCLYCALKLNTNKRFYSNAYKVLMSSSSIFTR